MRCRDDGDEGRVRVGRPWYLEARDQRRRDVGASLHPHEVVRDEAVEHATEEGEAFLVERVPDAEQRVRGQDAGRDDRRDEREPVRRGGDVAIGEARSPQTTAGAGEPFGNLPRDPVTGGPRVHDERLEVLAVDDWKARAGIDEVMAVLG